MEDRHFISEPRPIPGLALPTWEVDVLREGVEQPIMTLQLDNENLPPRKRKKKVLWKLPETLDQLPKFGKEDKLRILEIFKQHKRAGKREKRKSQHTPGGTTIDEHEEDDDDESPTTTTTTVKSELNGPHQNGITSLPMRPNIMKPKTKLDSPQGSTRQPQTPLPKNVQNKKKNSVATGQVLNSNLENLTPPTPLTPPAPPPGLATAATQSLASLTISETSTPNEQLPTPPPGLSLNNNYSSLPQQPPKPSTTPLPPGLPPQSNSAGNLSSHPSTPSHTSATMASSTTSLPPPPPILQQNSPWQSTTSPPSVMHSAMSNHFPPPPGLLQQQQQQQQAMPSPLTSPNGNFVSPPPPHQPLFPTRCFPIPSEGVNFIAQSVCRSYYEMLTQGCVNDLKLYYAEGASKSLTVGGAHAVCQSPTDLELQLQSMTGIVMHIRGVLQQLSLAGSILVVVSGMCLSPYSLPFSHSLILVPISLPPPPTTTTTTQSTPTTTTATTGYQILNDALCFLTTELPTSTSTTTATTTTTTSNNHNETTNGVANGTTGP